jgi:hypothetical protein
MRVVLGLGAVTVALAVATNSPGVANSPTLVLHKACAIGTLGMAHADGTCEFPVERGFAVVAGGVTFAWKPYRRPTADCAAKVVFDPPEIEPHRIRVHAHAEQQSDGSDCGGVMVYRIETERDPGETDEGSSARPDAREDPD